MKKIDGFLDTSAIPVVLDVVPMDTFKSEKREKEMAFYHQSIRGRRKEWNKRRPALYIEEKERSIRCFAHLWVSGNKQ